MRSYSDVCKYAKTIDSKDFSEILKCAKRLSKVEGDNSKVKLKIAVIGTSSLQFITMALKVMLLKEDINASVYEGQFNGINMDTLDYESDFYRFCPDIVIILTDYRSIHTFPQNMSGDREVDEWVEAQIDSYKSVWHHIGVKLPKCHIFQSNIVFPAERVLGNLECNYYFSKRACLILLNLQLMRQRPLNVTIVDLEYTASLIGKDNWFDDAAYMRSKSAFALQYIGIVSEIFARQIAALQGKIRKCLVLDLDNTLWGGIIGEDGYDGIQLDPNDAVGESYLAFQRYIRDLRNRGVILAVCSKNDFEPAKAVFFKNKNMILKFEDFAAFYANWDNKAENLKKMSTELNIGTDSFVFFDDNPAEREIINMCLPEVRVIDVPADPSDYVKALDRSNAFEWLQITKEDLQRNGTYQDNQKRTELKSKIVDYNEYLEALEMHASVCEPQDDEMNRFTQLINKSNQFNLRTQRYTDADIIDMRNNRQYKLLAVKLSDKFSNYGLISCVILKKDGEYLVIDTWVMSCRVLKRGVEYLTFQKILEISKEWGCTSIIGEYIPTIKNNLVKNFYADIDFNECAKEQFKTAESSEVFIYDVNRLFEKKTFFY